jgi:hypothetical protein
MMQEPVLTYLKQKKKERIIGLPENIVTVMHAHIIIIITGKTDLIESQGSVHYSVTILSIRPTAFHFFTFCSNIIFLQSKVVSLASNP